MNEQEFLSAPMADPKLHQPEVRPLVQETTLDGLYEPFQIMGSEPASNSEDFQAYRKNIAKYIIALQESNVREKSDHVKSDESMNLIDHYTPTQLTVPTETLVNYLFNLQTGTIQPKLANAVITGLLEFSSKNGSGCLTDHGGATRRAATPPKKWEYVYGHNRDEITRTLIRWEDNPLRKIPKSGSEIPEYENLATEVAARMSHPYNLDLYDEFNVDKFPEAAQIVSQYILQTLGKNGFESYTIYQNPEDGGIEIHLPYQEGLWKPHRVVGYEKTDWKTWQKEKSIYYFGPKTPPDKFVIKIHLVHPPQNPNWTILRTAWGIANDKGFTDVSEIYLNATPTETNGLMQLDNRNGLVDSRQKDLCMKIYTNGDTTIPSPELYAQFITRINSDDLTGKDINQLASLQHRIIRYGDIISAYDCPSEGSQQFPFNCGETTMEDLKQILTEIIRLHETENQMLSRAMMIENMTELSLGFHTGKYLIASAMRSLLYHQGIRDIKIYPRLLPVIFTDTAVPLSGISANGRAFVHRQDTNTYDWASDIPDFLRSVHYWRQKYMRELGCHYSMDINTIRSSIKNDPNINEFQKKQSTKERIQRFKSYYAKEYIQTREDPNGSPLARLLWYLEPFPDN